MCAFRMQKTDFVYKRPVMRIVMFLFFSILLHSFPCVQPYTCQQLDTTLADCNDHINLLRMSRIPLWIWHDLMTFPFDDNTVGHGAVLAFLPAMFVNSINHRLLFTHYSGVIWASCQLDYLLNNVTRLTTNIKVPHNLLFCRQIHLSRWILSTKDQWCTKRSQDMPSW